MDIRILISLVFFGIMVGFLCSLVGLGGGILFIPGLTILYDIPIDNAIGISIFCMTLLTLSSTIGYARNKSIDWKLGLMYDIFDIPGIILGAYISNVILSNHLNILELICGFAIVIIALLVLFKKQNDDIDISANKKEINSMNTGDIKEIEGSYWKKIELKWIVFSSFLGGLITGMVGLGGGTVDTTSMILLGVPIDVAAGSSSFAMLLTNIVGFISYASFGNILWGYAVAIGVFAFFGAQIGTKYSSKFKKTYLRKMLGCIALFTGIRLLL